MGTPISAASSVGRLLSRTSKSYHALSSAPYIDPVCSVLREVLADSHELSICKRIACKSALPKGYMFVDVVPQ